MGNGENGMGRDNLSSVSTILGLSLFCLLIATIIVRRMMVHRRNRRFAQERLWAAAAVIGGRGHRASDGPENDEPQTIAIGARAALLKRPVIWEDSLTLSNSLYGMKKVPGGSYWAHLQPTALQLLTPHTTAHFPKSSRTSRSPHGASGSNRISRAYSHFLFHRDHIVPPNTPNVDSSAVPRSSLSTRNERRVSQSSVPPRRISASFRSQQMPTPAPYEEQEDKVEKEDGTNSHPVHLTFIISMPDPSASSYSQSGSPPQPIVLIPIALGTTQPNARLPSIVIKQDELDSWWDLPPSSPRLYNATSGLTAGQMLQLEIQRERMEREAQRARTMHVGL